MLVRFISAIQLTRLTMAFGAISDLWFVMLYTRAVSDYEHVPVFGLPLWAALGAGAVVAVGLFAYGASLNDVLDVRHDSAFSPDRPIPAGRIKVGQAVVVAVGALIVAVLGGVLLGTWAVCLTLLIAAGLLFYNAAAKYIPPAGVVTIGLLHAGHMFIPNFNLSFVLPVWLVMTHTMVIAVAVHVLEDKRPRFGRASLIAACIGWVFWSGVLLGWGFMRGDGLWPEHASLLGALAPALTVLAFVAMAWWKTRAITGVHAAEKLKRYGAMWQSLYGAAWLWALGYITQAMWIGAFALVGFAVMTVIREVTGLTGRPVSFRA